MKNKLSAVILCCLSLLLAFGGISVSAESNENTIAEAQSFVDGILTYQLNMTDSGDVQEWLNTALTEGAGTTSEWYVITLSQYGSYDTDSYESALLNYLSENTVNSASSRLKYALALSAVGSTDAYISDTLNNSIGKQGIMSLVFGLHLLNNGYESDEITKDDLIARILSMQKSDGGWAVMGDYGDNDVTAMTLQALAPYYAENEDCTSAISSALDLLSKRQLDDGDYASYGVPNPESTSQVIVALSSLGIDFQDDERFIKNGNTLLDGLAKYRLSDGSFCHTAGGTANATSTLQAFYACVSYLRLKNGQSPLYILDRSDPESVEPPTVPNDDTENELPTGGNSNKDDAASVPNDFSNETKTPSYKVWVCLGIVAVGGVAALVLMLLKKKSIKNYIAIILVVVIGIVFVCITDFRKPEDYYNGNPITKENPIGAVTISIRCDTVVGKAEHIPQDGVILPETEVPIEADETVYDVLAQIARANKLQFENEGNEKMAYISGIAYLYEFDYGDLSGWMYFVNGESPSVGCGEYTLSDGDIIEWKYTCNMGDDLK